ncbi:MAG: prepilin-type N-terminal cleavage/methylation domain-containing protein [Kofleriaceae bacterium]|nr:prepilin-type N-terminal cleavage/methylation domain-containing protein [Kofleriaceae bacterium]
MKTLTETVTSQRWTVRLADALARRQQGQRRGQRGMTLLEIMIVLAILALVMGLVVGPRVLAMFGESKVKIAKATVGKYANEAFPQWSMNNTGKACPGQLNDLNTYMNNADGKDPWGTPYKMLCGSNLPAGAKGLAVISAGEDAKEGTADDIKSWE